MVLLSCIKLDYRYNVVLFLLLVFFHVYSSNARGTSASALGKVSRKRDTWRNGRQGSSVLPARQSSFSMEQYLRGQFLRQQFLRAQATKQVIETPTPDQQSVGNMRPNINRGPNINRDPAKNRGPNTGLKTLIPGGRSISSSRHSVASTMPPHIPVQTRWKSGHIQPGQVGNSRQVALTKSTRPDTNQPRRHISQETLFRWINAHLSRQRNQVNALKNNENLQQSVKTRTKTASVVQVPQKGAVIGHAKQNKSVSKTTTTRASLIGMKRPGKADVRSSTNSEPKTIGTEMSTINNATLRNTTPTKNTNITLKAKSGTYVPSPKVTLAIKTKAMPVAARKVADTRNDKVTNASPVAPVPLSNSESILAKLKFPALVNMARAIDKKGAASDKGSTGACEPHCPIAGICNNGATCVNTCSGFTCACAPGFTGIFCDTVIIQELLNTTTTKTTKPVTETTTAIATSIPHQPIDAPTPHSPQTVT